MKTVTISKAFKKNATGRDSLVRIFRKGIEEMLESLSSKLDNFSIENGVVTLSIEEDAASEKVIASIKQMRGTEVTVSNSTFERFLEQYNREQESAVS